MLQLPTVLLRHTCHRDRHFDWLLADPAAPHGPLWTARVALPSTQWRHARVWLVEQIGMHRRRYLTYEGPLSGGRGHVARVDRGTFTALRWTASRRVIDVRFRHFIGRVHLQRVAGPTWRAAVADASAVVA